MSKFRKGEKVMYYGAFNEELEESVAKVIKTNHKTGAVYVRVEFPAYQEGCPEGPCEQWVHPKQLRKCP